MIYANKPEKALSNQNTYRTDETERVLRIILLPPADRQLELRFCKQKTLINCSFILGPSSCNRIALCACVLRAAGVFLRFYFGREARMIDLVKIT